MTEKILDSIFFGDSKNRPNKMSGSTVSGKRVGGDDEFFHDDFLLLKGCRLYYNITAEWIL